jgi:polar amino acid transport system permease protein
MSPRKRARLSRGIQYAVLLLIVVVAAFLVDWATVKDSFFDMEILRSMWPDVVVMRLSPVGPYRWLATGFIEFFRGVPALVVFIGLGYGMPLAFQRELPGGTLGVATVALGLVGGAYMAETIRAGIQAVPKGQLEAARSLGMSQGRAMVSIVIPQAFRIILPPLTNELILLTKDSSLIYVLGYSSTTLELTAFGREVLNQEKNLTPLVGIGICYLMITIPLSIIVRRMEARAEKAR